MAERPNSSQLLALSLQQMGGIDGYAAILVHDFQQLRECAEQEGMASVKAKRVLTVYHGLFKSLFVDVDRGEIEAEQHRMNKEEALAIVLEELRKQLPHNPELRRSLAEQLRAVEPALVARFVEASDGAGE